ncbi:L-seryl-tRNA(Sec) selenium transferase [Planctomycetota bacterium]|nr:L-seryl-tRNA(Sec) selenium transferase [Planctomycetota bacterium]
MVTALLPMHRTDSERGQALRTLPSVDRLLQHPLLLCVPRALLVRQVRRCLDDAREKIEAGELTAEAAATMFGGDAGARLLLAQCAVAAESRHRRVYNATGIVLHTGIGRAPLCGAAVAALQQMAGYGFVEVDPKTGERDERELGVAKLLCELTGAGAALVVNNNAAATTLALAALCAGREVVVSRGELVEIGGGFRMPDVMKRAGCLMVEVGATNRTHLRDYEQAITKTTAALLKVHPSNFRIEGFTSTPPLAELGALAAAREILLIDDLGSGLLIDTPIPLLEDEPSVSQSLAASAHIVCFSADKLLGGPQCGILLGDRERIAKVRAHPLYRALRCDKLTLAALEATLFVYRDGEPLHEIPSLRMLSAKEAELRARSELLLKHLAVLGAHIVASESYAGSGANPARPLPSFAVAVPGGAALCDRLRAAVPVPIFARVAANHVVLDARTLLLEDLTNVAAGILQVVHEAR